MTHYTSTSRVVSALIGVLAALLASTTTFADGAQVRIGPNALSVSPTVNASRLELRVAGPGDFFAARHSDGSPIDWYAPAGLPEGAYRYEVFTLTSSEADDEEDRRLYREHGRFTIEGGLLQPKEVLAPPEPQAAREVPAAPSLLARLAHGLLTVLVPEVQALQPPYIASELEIENLVPYLYFDLIGTTYLDWELAGGASFVLRTQKPSATSPNMLVIHKDSGPYVLDASANGDIALADGTVYIDKSAIGGSRVGIGTISPRVELEIVSTSPTIYLDDTDGRVWGINANTGSQVFDIRDVTNGLVPFQILSPTDSYTLTINGPYVGVGTQQPDAPLHVDVGLADPVGVGNAVALFQRTDTQPLAIQLKDESTGDFVNNSYVPNVNRNLRQYRISFNASGGPDVIMRPRNDVGGPTLEVDGSVLADNVTFSSSRSLKTDIEPLAVDDVLARLVDLPMAQWRFKTEAATVRHYGPMAEDFQKDFAPQGNVETISLVDANGIALAAIQALAAKNNQLAAENNQLEADNDALKERVTAIETMLATLIKKTNP